MIACYLFSMVHIQMLSHLMLKLRPKISHYRFSRFGARWPATDFRVLVPWRPPYSRFVDAQFVVPSHARRD